MFEYTDTPDALSLDFSPHLRVAGDTVEGQVRIHFPTLIADGVIEVQVKLRGTLFAEVEKNRPNGHGGVHASWKNRKTNLFHDKITLWTKNSGVYPPQGTQSLTFPFRFVLPTHVLPSFAYFGYDEKGVVGYLVEAFGERPGLHFNHRVKVPFPVLPANPQGEMLSASLRTTGWRGAYRAIEANQNMRRGIFGDYSQVKATLLLPDITEFPIFSPIPFSLHIESLTKMMKFEETPTDEPIFPEPPTHPKGIEFTLERKALVQAGLMHQQETSWHTEQNLGGLGASDDAHFYDTVQVQPVEKVWFPASDHHDAKKHKGQWKQEVTFRSYFVLKCPPSFRTDNLDLKYNAKLNIEFAGIGNDVSMEFPMDIISCMNPVASGLWAGPPPVLNLLPEYLKEVSYWDDEDAA